MLYHIIDCSEKTFQAINLILNNFQMLFKETFYTYSYGAHKWKMIHFVYSLETFMLLISS